MTDAAGLIVFRNTLAGAAGWSPEEEHGPGPRGWSLDYLRARERAERAAAKCAHSMAARHVHQELAQHYAELARRAS